MKKCIIIANGKTPKKNIIPFLQKNGYTTIFCADGGANSARKLGIIPDYIIGDLDSISPENLKYFSVKTRVKKIKGQDDTDVEKCLKFAINAKFSQCVLLGVIGDRLDHSFGNLSIAKRYSDFISIVIISDKSILSVCKGNMKLNTRAGETISIYGFDTKTKITTRGLKYQIQNEPFPFGEKESTSNEALGTEVDLTIKHGKVFVIRSLSELMKRMKTGDSTAI
ncbi:MAG: thiamine diphosphokinase [Bacillota bacterium]